MYKSDFQEKPNDEKLYLIYEAASDAKMKADEAYTAAAGSRLFALIAVVSSLVFGVKQCNDSNTKSDLIKELYENQYSLEERVDALETALDDALSEDEEGPQESGSTMTTSVPTPATTYRYQ